MLIKTLLTQVKQLPDHNQEKETLQTEFLRPMQLEAEYTKQGNIFLFLYEVIIDIHTYLDWSRTALCTMNLTSVKYNTVCITVRYCAIESVIHEGESIIKLS